VLLPLLCCAVCACGMCDRFLQLHALGPCYEGPLGDFTGSGMLPVIDDVLSADNVARLMPHAGGGAPGVSPPAYRVHFYSHPYFCDAGPAVWREALHVPTAGVPMSSENVVLCISARPIARLAGTNLSQLYCAAGASGAVRCFVEGAVFAVAPCRIPDIAPSLSDPGVLVALGLLECAPGRAAVAVALRLLVSLAASSPSARAGMARTGTYPILAHLLCERAEAGMVDEACLRLTLQLCGARDVPVAPTPYGTAGGDHGRTLGDIQCARASERDARGRK
jgi:hypothetical protein